MAVYKHGVYVTEQPTGVVAPVQSTAGLQVVIGTAPINRASDPYHCTNVTILATSLKEATAALGYDDDYDKYGCWLQGSGRFPGRVHQRP